MAECFVCHGVAEVGQVRDRAGNTAVSSVSCTACGRYEVTLTEQANIQRLSKDERMRLSAILKSKFDGKGTVTRLTTGDAQRLLLQETKPKGKP
jgi:hypothetical protein